MLAFSDDDSLGGENRRMKAIYYVIRWRKLALEAAKTFEDKGVLMKKVNDALASWGLVSLALEQECNNLKDATRWKGKEARSFREDALFCC